MNQAMSTDQRRELLALMEERARRSRRNRLARYAPYRKQAEFHAMGASRRERMLSAGNQLGKTLCAANEAAIQIGRAHV